MRLLNDATPWLSYAVALGIGLLIGAERERNKGNGSTRGAEGIRTFSLAAVLGAVSMHIAVTVLITAIISVMLFSALGYYRQSHAQHDDPGMTTELAFVLTVVLGGLAIVEAAMAAAIGVMVAILLAAKQPIHAFVRDQISTQELHDLLIFAAATLIVLPLLPNQTLGPFSAINPQQIWMVVVLVMGISALSHVVLRLMRARLALALVGLVSGFISSLAVVQSMGVRVREHPEQLYAAVASASCSSLATLLQLGLLLGAVYTPLLKIMLWPLLCGAVTMLCFAGWMTLKSWHNTFVPSEPSGKMLSLSNALSFALVVTLVMLLSAGLMYYWGATGLLLSSAFAGLADAHAPTVAVASLAATGQLALPSSGLPILLAFSSNTLAKAVVAHFSRANAYGMWVSLGLGLQLIAVWLGWWFTL